MRVGRSRGSLLLGIGALLVSACSSGGASAHHATTLPTPTTPTTRPIEVEIRKLDHLVVLMQENRSFDSYFGPLDSSGPTAPNATTGNPDPTHPGSVIEPFHNPNICETADLSHGWAAVHKQIDGGRMDGFTTTNADLTNPSGSRALAEYGPKDLAYYYALAKTFGIGERYFASVPGPTYPNRYYLTAGTSFGHIDNALPPAGGWPQKTIFEELDAARVSWKIYDAQIAIESLLFKYVHDHSAGHVFPISQYFTDASAGTLPQVTFVEPTFVGTAGVETDEHPPANPQVGQQFTARVVDALMHSPDWSSSAFFLTWDEHGGYHDRVAPPAAPAPAPDGIAPIGGPDDTRAAFDLYGVRVPVLVISPWSRPHYVSNVVHDHTSLLRTIELRFGLKPLTRRDALARPMTEFFDFSHPAFTTPPELPAAAVEPRGVAQCTALWGDKVLGI